MESGKVRSSNFELLRIAAMLMIVMFHIFLHWPKAQLTDMNSINFFGNGLFNHPEFYPQLWLGFCLHPKITTRKAIPFPLFSASQV